MASIASDIVNSAKKNNRSASKTLAVRISEDLHDYLKDVADEHGINLGDLVRACLVKFRSSNDQDILNAK